MKFLKILGKPFTFLAGKVDATVQAKVVGSLLRHGATALGAVLVAKGLLSPSADGPFVDNLTELLGLLIAGVGTASGTAQKLD